MNRPITNNTMDDDYDLLDFAMGLERQTIPLLHSNRSTDIVSLNNNRSENINNLNNANTGNHVNRANSGTHDANNTNISNLASANIINLAVANNVNSNNTTIPPTRIPRHMNTYDYDYRMPAPVPRPSIIPASQRLHDLRRSQETNVMTITGESDTEAEDDEEEEEDNQEEERGQIPLVSLEDGETDFEAFSMEIEETLPEDREISLDDNFALENVTLDNYYALQRTRITLPKAYVAENYFKKHIISP